MISGVKSVKPRENRRQQRWAGKIAALTALNRKNSRSNGKHSRLNDLSQEKKAPLTAFKRENVGFIGIQLWKSGCNGVKERKKRCEPILIDKKKR